MRIQIDFDELDIETKKYINKILNEYVPKKKKIFVYNIRINKEYGVYNSIKEAADATGINRTSITGIKDYKIVKDYIYSKKEIKNLDLIESNKLYAYYNNKEYIFLNTSEASEKTGCGINNIRNRIKNRTQLTKLNGWIFSYKQLNKQELGLYREDRYDKTKQYNQYTLDGKYITSYYGAKKAVYAVTGDYNSSIKPITLSATSHNNTRVAYGYRWTISEIESKKIPIELPERQYKIDKRTLKKVVINDSKKYMNIKQYDLDGNLIGIYKSITEASNITEIHRTAISKCIKEKNHTAGGYYWRANDDNTIFIKHKNGESSRKPVVQLNKNGEVINEYISINEAAEKTGLLESNISCAVRGVAKYCGLFIWCYKKDLDKYINKKSTNPKRDRPIYMHDMNTKEIIKKYKNMTEAEKQTGISLKNISVACRNNEKNNTNKHASGGYIWTYAD